jgi:hypothetical protein
VQCLLLLLLLYQSSHALQLRLTCRCTLHHHWLTAQVATQHEVLGPRNKLVLGELLLLLLQLLLLLLL